MEKTMNKFMLANQKAEDQHTASVEREASKQAWRRKKQLDIETSKIKNAKSREEIKHNIKERKTEILVGNFQAKDQVRKETCELEKYADNRAKIYMNKQAETQSRYMLRELARARDVERFRN